MSKTLHARRVAEVETRKAWTLDPPELPSPKQVFPSLSVQEGNRKQRRVGNPMPDCVSLATRREKTLYKARGFRPEFLQRQQQPERIPRTIKGHRDQARCSLFRSSRQSMATHNGSRLVDRRRSLRAWLRSQNRPGPPFVQPPALAALHRALIVPQPALSQPSTKPSARQRPHQSGSAPALSLPSGP